MPHSLHTLWLIAFFSFMGHLLQLRAAEWRSYPFTSTYRSAQMLGDKLYLLKSNSILQAHLATWQPDHLLSRQEGLSGTEVVCMLSSRVANRLVVVYADGLIDLFYPDGSITTLPDYYNAPMQGIDKEILSVREQQGQLFLCTAYGFVVVDLCREVIISNVQLGQPVRCAWAYQDRWYYSTQQGTYSSPRRINASGPAQWQHISEQSITAATILPDADQCLLLTSNHQLGRITPQHTQIETDLLDADVRSLHEANGHLFALCPDRLLLIDDLSQPLTCASTLSLASLQGLYSLHADQQQITLLDHQAGATVCSLQTDAAAGNFRLETLTDAPLIIDNHQQSATIDRLVLSPDGEVGMSHVGTLQTPYANMMVTRGYLTTYQDDSWSNYTASVVSGAVTEGQKRLVGITDFIADPLHPARYWFSTLEDGIVGIDHGKFLVRYNHATTDGALQNCAYLCTRTGGLAVSPQGDLWCTNEGVISLLKVRQESTGQWHSFTLPSLESAYGFTHLIHTRQGHQLWGMQQFTYQQSHIFVYDYGRTIDDPSDDRVVVFRELKPQNSSAVTPYYGRAIEEGPDGTIYLLNTSGLYAVDAPDQVFSHPGQVRALLQDVIPTSITFDSRQRIWVSTEANGLFLLSADGRHQLAHITSTDSPLPPGEILSLCFDQQTDALWIATVGNLFRFTYSPDEFGHQQSSSASSVAYCYPASATQGSHSVINLFGLKDFTAVSLTDGKGRLLLQETAQGGLVSIPTRTLSAGSYTLTGTDRQGFQGIMATFEVLAE